MTHQTWFTSDLHFGHERVIAYCDRPWPNVDEMDAALIERWNERVQRNDQVYVLGDFALTGVERRKELLAGLNGRITLIRGNHDGLGSDRDLFEGVYDLRTVRLGEERAVLCHYPLETWQNEAKGWWHFHGHSHGRRTQDRDRRVDVGVDCWDYRPRTFEELTEGRV